MEFNDYIKDLQKARPRYYVLHGHEVVGTHDITEWGEWHRDFNNRIVDRTVLMNGNILVSTVCVGIDMGFNFGRSEDYQPLVFETMVFDELNGGKCVDHYTDRYAHWEVAQQGHNAIVVDIIKNGVQQDATGITEC